MWREIVTALRCIRPDYWGHSRRGSEPQQALSKMGTVPHDKTPSQWAQRLMSSRTLQKESYAYLDILLFTWDQIAVKNFTQKGFRLAQPPKKYNRSENKWKKGDDHPLLCLHGDYLYGVHSQEHHYQWRPLCKGSKFFLEVFRRPQSGILGGFCQLKSDPHTVSGDRSSKIAMCTGSGITRQMYRPAYLRWRNNSQTFQNIHTFVLLWLSILPWDLRCGALRSEKCEQCQHWWHTGDWMLAQWWRCKGLANLFWTVSWSVASPFYCVMRSSSSVASIADEIIVEVEIFRLSTWMFFFYMSKCHPVTPFSKLHRT